MVQIAKAYGLADVGLRKICKRLNIPTPPQGYWARKNRKGPPKSPPTDDPTVHIISSIEKPESVEPEYFDPRTKALIARERDKKNTIKVAERLRTPHPIVEKIRKKLDSRGPDDVNRVLSHKSGRGIGVCNGSISTVIKGEKAKQIREFIEAVEQKYSPIHPTSEPAAWLIWAHNHANLLDPLKKAASGNFATLKRFQCMRSPNFYFLRHTRAKHCAQANTEEIA